MNGDNDFYSLVKLKFTETGLPTTIQQFDEAALFYPNPADDFIYFNNPSEITDVALYDIRCQLIIIHRPKEGFLNISNLSSGVYFLKTKYINQSTQMNKIIVN